MRKYWIPTIGLLVLLAACTAPTPAAPATGTAPTLAGTSWTVTQIKGQPTIATSPATMRFADDRVSGTTGCNSYGAGYSQSGTGLAISQAAMTAMACTVDGVMAQEQSFGAALAAVAAVRTAGTGLELLDSGQQVVFTLAPVENKPLEGTAWQLSGIITKDAVASPVAGSNVTMQLGGGKLSGKACNNFSGQVIIDGANFKAGPLMSTKMACPSKEESAQETQMLTILQSATTFSIEASKLSLSAPDGTGLEFTAKS